MDSTQRGLENHCSIDHNLVLLFSANDNHVYFDGHLIFTNLGSEVV